MGLIPAYASVARDSAIQRDFAPSVGQHSPVQRERETETHTHTHTLSPPCSPSLLSSPLHFLSCSEGHPVFAMLRLGSRRSFARSLAGARSFASTAPRRAEIELEIDGKTVKIEQGAALIQACEKAGAHIPRYCYHEKLQIAGNCRM